MRVCHDIKKEFSFLPQENWGHKRFHYGRIEHLQCGGFPLMMQCL